MIKTAADAVSGSTRSWAERLRMVYSLDNEPLPQTKDDLPRMDYTIPRHWSGADAAVGIINNIPYTLERETNEVVVRLQLYIEDERTVEVLVKHIQELIVDHWMYWRETTWNLYNGEIRDKIPTEEMFREIVVRGCREDWVYVPAPIPYDYAGEVARRNAAASSSTA